MPSCPLLSRPCWLSCWGTGWGHRALPESSADHEPENAKASPVGMLFLWCTLIFATAIRNRILRESPLTADQQEAASPLPAPSCLQDRGQRLTDSEGATPLCLRLSFLCPGLVPPSRKSPAGLSRIQIPHLRHGRSRPFLITGHKKRAPEGALHDKDADRT